ncbi:ROK family transcriptional regulator [Dietzia alimentaria]|uniref:ROK family transcriptional regulator n=1 Tax=Dietzia alimentaria TaxID=665550 RepID=UPI00029A7CB1|nr:ROK family transcriptional regulator [Dietzia alimentaria]
MPFQSPVAGLRLSDNSSARVMRAIRFRGPVSRPEIAARTGLSVATVGRATSALVAAGVIRERPAAMHDGSVGRPSIPVEIDPSGPVTIAVHIGLHRSVVAVCDLACRILSEHAISTPGREPARIADELTAVAFRLLDGYRDRRLVRGGIATAARITETGRIDHDLLGWEDVPVTDLFADRIGVPFSVAPHVEAMAATELLVGHETHQGTTLVVYAREHLGSALVIDGVVHQPRAGSPDLTHLPVGPTQLLADGGNGLLDVVGDSGVVRAAGRHGIEVGSVAELAVRARRDAVSEAILVERATVLGRVVGLLSSITRPDTVVLCGQAFTDHPRYLPALVRATRETRLVGGVPDLRISTAGGRIQQFAAMAVALDTISADPTAALAGRALSAS